MFVERLQKKGFKVGAIADALALNKEDWLTRRLQTILLTKGLTTTSKQARQLITHKHVSIGNQIVNIPSYQVGLEEEPLVKLDLILKLNKPKSKEEEIKKEILDKEILEDNSEKNKSSDINNSKKIIQEEPEIKKEIQNIALGNNK